MSGGPTCSSGKAPRLSRSWRPQRQSQRTRMWQSEVPKWRSDGRLLPFSLSCWSAGSRSPRQFSGTNFESTAICRKRTEDSS